MTRAALLAVVVAILTALPIVAAAQHSPAPPATSPVSSAGAADPCPAPDAIVAKLQARYDTTSAFRADFSQRTTVTSVGDSDEAKGTVAFRKPGKMRWNYQAPDEQQIISDGTTMWIYQPADKQAIKAPFKAAFVSSTPISFLTGVGRITDDFKPQRDPRGCTADRIYVKLLPKDASDLGALALGVERSTYDIVEAAVTDPIGNVTTLAFTALQRNVDVPESEFKFDPPPGADVIVAPGGGAPLQRE